MGGVYSTGDNELVVITGGCCNRSEKKYLMNGAQAWAWYGAKKNVLPTILTMSVVCHGTMVADSVNGKRITLKAVAVCKLLEEEIFIVKACEKFLGQTATEIEQSINEVIEERFQYLLTNLDLDKIRGAPKDVAEELREIVCPRVALLGYEIYSLKITDIIL